MSSSLTNTEVQVKQRPAVPQPRALERTFPIKEISQLAQQESWRKEVNRPIYHIHKWWAQRLGSVFRAMILGALTAADTDIWEKFYKRHDLSGKVVLDPFMGSGTTLGEAAKLGAKPVGIDINPVSTFIVTQSLTRVDVDKLERLFVEIEADVKEHISHYYKTIDPETGGTIPVLYYFWVKEVITPGGEVIPLFSSYVFSKDAYPKKKPIAQIVCPSCGGINSGRYDATVLLCVGCRQQFNPQTGSVEGQYVTDSLGRKYKIKDLIAESKQPPRHRLYALMALKSNGSKVYLPPSSYDFSLLEEAREQFLKESLPIPDMVIRPGHNTNQARGYNYLNWRDFFNERQLLCLGMLLRRILRIGDEALRNQFICLFSSTLEFNNLFCSFKGEGTGAVRPLFSHHILKPERTVLENCVWGTDKSSGTFSTLFRSRLLKAKRYLESPFEVGVSQSLFDNARLIGNGKVNSSAELNLTITDRWEQFSATPHAALVLNGDGAKLPIPENSVDAVITDPPYFDFVHYSELSDFFFAWLAPALKQEYSYFDTPDSSRNEEVQSLDPKRFSEKLARVFLECNRVLKNDGVLSFSFHHSRADGWLSIYDAITNAGFMIVAAYPIHGEMSVASPKSSTKEPITLDAILVCKKSLGSFEEIIDIPATVKTRTAAICNELRSTAFSLSQADTYVVAMSQALALGSRCGYSLNEMSSLLNQFVLLR